MQCKFMAGEVEYNLVEETPPISRVRYIPLLPMGSRLVAERESMNYCRA